jgi:hypothetical protein
MIATFATFIYYPRISMQNARTVVIYIWAFSLLMAVPRGYYAEVFEMGYDDKEFCYLDNDVARTYRIFYTLIKCLIPSCVIVASLVLKIQQKESDVKINRMLLVLAVTFVTLESPFMWIRILEDHFILDISFAAFVTADLMSTVAFFYKPFVYFLLDDDFRKEFMKTVSVVRGQDDAELLHVNEME